MQLLDDNALLREYAEHGSEDAFAVLVTRHIDKVYSVALRQTGNADEAGEITQAVFVILARKAPRLNNSVILSGWLYHTARLTSMTYIRSEIRRRQREQEAHMRSTLEENDTEAWLQIAPLLEAAMAGLNETDRHAVVLRFFDGKSMGEVGVALGANEDAAKKRVTRAVEKLRRYFTKRGVVLPVAVLTAAIAANSVQAAPAVLAKTATTLAVAKGATASASTLTLIKGALKFMAWTKMKTAVVAGVVAVLLAGTATTVIVVERNHGPQVHPLTRGQTEFPRASWAFAGYGDPDSALMSYIWASVCQTNRSILEASFTAAQKSVYDQMIRENLKASQHHSEAQAVAEQFRRADDEWRNGGYRVLDKKLVSEGQVVFRLLGYGPRGEMEVEAVIKKIGSEWRYDGIQSHKVLTNTNEP